MGCPNSSHSKARGHRHARRERSSPVRLHRRRPDVGRDRGHRNVRPTRRRLHRAHHLGREEDDALMETRVVAVNVGSIRGVLRRQWHEGTLPQGSDSCAWFSCPTGSPTDSGGRTSAPMAPGQTCASARRATSRRDSPSPSTAWRDHRRRAGTRTQNRGGTAGAVPQEMRFGPGVHGGADGGPPGDVVGELGLGVAEEDVGDAACAGVADLGGPDPGLQGAGVAGDGGLDDDHQLVLTRSGYRRAA